MDHNILGLFWMSELIRKLGEGSMLFFIFFAEGMLPPEMLIIKAPLSELRSRYQGARRAQSNSWNHLQRHWAGWQAPYWYDQLFTLISTCQVIECVAKAHSKMAAKSSYTLRQSRTNHIVWSNQGSVCTGTLRKKDLNPMSSENKRLTGACVPAAIDLFEHEPKSKSIGFPSRNGSTKVPQINLSPSLPFSEDSEKGILCSLVHSANEVAALCAASLQPDAILPPSTSDPLQTHPRVCKGL